MPSERPFDRVPNNQTASWFLDVASAGRLELDPPYQRRSVWNLEYRQFFIDSVVRNYPTQSVFLDVDVDPDQPTVYKVLDGKQRLTSLITFVQDEFTAPDSLADLDLADKYYSQFPRDMKRRILGYVFTVESCSNVTAAELNQAFDRLNRNVSRLNRQELRHAQYGGRFITRMESLAESSFWEEIGLVTLARRRRMLDVEYVSELFVVSARGIQDGKDYLDAIYAEWDDEIEDERRSDRLFRRTQAYLAAVDEVLPIASTRFRNVADFYSLWAAVSRLLTAGGQAVEPHEAAKRLGTFIRELDQQATDRVRSYLLAARQGSNKSNNRELRARTLLAVLQGE